MTPKAPNDSIDCGCHRLSGLWLAAASLLAVVGVSGQILRPADPLVTRWEGTTMGTTYRVQIAGVELAPQRQQELRIEVEDQLAEINRQVSHYRADSELSRFNRASAEIPFKISPGFARVVRFSLEMSRRSHGAFDPTLAPLVNLWGFGEMGRKAEPPPEAAVQEALAQVGWRHLTVTHDDELIKRIPGLQLNLSGVAKGFGVDQMQAILKAHGFTNVYVSIGGEVRVQGVNPEGVRWRVGISAPINHWREDDPMILVASLSNQAISTSGDYQNFFVDDAGRRLSHLIDPRTGHPVRHHVAGVTVVASDGMTADALGTTLFVLGEQAGLKFIESRTNAAALFIVRESDGTFRRRPSSRFSKLAGLE